MKLLFSPSVDMIPLIKIMKARDHQILCFNAGFLKQLNDMDLGAVGIEASVGPDVREKGFSEAARVLSYLMGQSYPQDGLHPAVSKFFDRSIWGFLYPRLADLAIFLGALEAAEPDGIVLHNDVEPVTKAAALWGQKKGIPALHVPHAVYLDHPDRGPAGEDIHDLIAASHLAAAGPFQARWYEERGFSPERICITGLPKFDRWMTARYNRDWARNLLGLVPHKPVFTYASSWRQDTNLLGCHDEVAEAYRAFLAATKENFAGAQIIIKVHPSTDPEPFAALARETGISCLLTIHHLEVLLQASDVLVSIGPSNLIIESSFIPWLQLVSIRGFEDDPEVVTVDPDPGQIAEAVSEALGTPPVDRTNFQKKYCGLLDGKASERIAGWLGELVS
jgi:hypothetical protein